MTLAARRTVIENPNDLQRRASDPKASVWVNASAGSGKTSVLTKRVMRLLLSGVRPEKILCLTYTRAGAAEMANRITSVLGKWAVCDEETLRQDLQDLENKAPAPGQFTEARRLFAKVLSCPGGLRIRTIHSFCQEILSRFPIEAGLPPHFVLLEGPELESLKSEVLDDLLREAAESPESELAQSLSALVAVQGESGFDEMLKEVVKASRRIGSQKLSELVKKTRGYLALDPKDTPENIRYNAINSIDECQLRNLGDWLSRGSKRYSDRGKRIQNFLTLSPSERKIHDYIGFFLNSDGECYDSTFIASKGIREEHPEIDSICMREADRLSLVLERIEAAETAETTECVLRLGLAFAKRLAQRKAARAALDYDDLILFTEKLLRRNGIEQWVRYKLDNGLEHILLDESQDTSLAQWNIMESLSEEFYAGESARPDNRTLFVVGDEKQSIFSFQNADPEAFLSRRTFFTKRFKDAGKLLDSVAMRTSFRSAQKVLDAVDAVFAQEAACISPDPIQHNAHPNPDGTEKLGRVEVWPLYEKPKREKDKSGEWIMPTTRESENDPQAELAAAIAQKIRGWLQRGDVLPGEKTPIAPGDIMILLRHRGRFADLMVRALKAAKVPVTGVDRMHLIDELPVMDLLAMIRFVLLPEDDLNLATLLRTPFIGITEEQLMQLAINREASLWESVKSSSFIETRDYLLSKLNEADFSTPVAFLSNILNNPCPANASSGRKALWARLGDEALDPVEELLNEAQRFSRSHPPSLQNFLHWLTQSDIEIKRELEHGKGQVRIMTVHASKGLEAPIVFLPDTVSKPQPQRMDKFYWAENDTPLFIASKPSSALLLRLWQNARDRQMEEYRRLFYVAMTRASRRLYVCGWKGEKEDRREDSWYGLALSGLDRLHQDFLAPEPDGPTPIIAFADTRIAPAIQPGPPQPAAKNPVLPAWATSPPETQEPPASSPSYASGLSAATPDAAFARGRVIHRLLQSLPEIPAEKRPSAIARFLSAASFNLTQTQRGEIAAEVQKLIDDDRFVTLFSADSLAEVPLTGALGGSSVFRQIDRLCLLGKEVWIVDYKTNRPPPEREQDIPLIYRKQLEEYRLLLKGIYPDKKARCFLLWTYAPLLMEILNPES